MAPTLGHVGFAVWVFLIFFLSLSCGKTNLDGREQVVEIDVKPGGVVHTYEENLGDITCKFTFSCQGGTNEKWNFVISQTPDGTAGCTVERPSGKSYLFFQTFKMEIKGVDIQDASGYADGGTMLNPNELKVNKKTNSVTQMDGQFNSQLSKLELFGRIHHRKKEL